jgi:hypothetical protein
MLLSHLERCGGGTKPPWREAISPPKPLNAEGAKVSQRTQRKNQT